MKSILVSTACLTTLLFSCTKKEKAQPEKAETEVTKPEMAKKEMPKDEMANIVSAKAVIAAKSGSSVSGTLDLLQEAESQTITANLKLSGLTPGDHGFHIHEIGDCSSEDGKSAGGHFNPEATKHGAMDAKERHKGDFGNITAGENGDVTISVALHGVSFDSKESSNIIGRAVVVHAKADDLTSQPSGNAGPRVGCGVITLN